MKKIKIIVLTICLFIPFLVNALEINDLYSENVIVYNKDENKILYEKNSEDTASIASLTKIMTTLVSIENIKDLNEKVTILENKPANESKKRIDEIKDKLLWLFIGGIAVGLLSTILPNIPW